MPSSCAVATCTSYYNNKNQKDRVHVTYHRFPKDKKVQIEWIVKCKRADEFNVENAKVCSEHFVPTDYERNLKAELLGLQSRPKLKLNAVPSVKLPFQPVELPSATFRNSRLFQRNLLKNEQERLTSMKRQLNDEMLEITENVANNSLNSESADIGEGLPFKQLFNLNMAHFTKKLKTGIVCAILHCDNCSGEDYMMHRFPTDLQLCAAWVNKCRRSDIDEMFKIGGAEYCSRNYLVCSNHFPATSYNKSKGLHIGTIPSINLPVCPMSTKTSPKRPNPINGYRSPSPPKPRVLESDPVDSVFPNALQCAVSAEAMLKLHACRFDNCGLIFTDGKLLHIHALEVHCSYKHKCPICDKPFRTNLSLEQHKLKHEGPHVRWKCKICQTIFNQKSELKEHFRFHSEPDKVQNVFQPNQTSTSTVREDVLDMELSHIPDKVQPANQVQVHNESHTRNLSNDTNASSVVLNVIDGQILKQNDSACKQLIKMCSSPHYVKPDLHSLSYRSWLESYTSVCQNLVPPLSAKVSFSLQHTIMTLQAILFKISLPNIQHNKNTTEGRNVNKKSWYKFIFEQQTILNDKLQESFLTKLNS